METRHHQPIPSSRATQSLSQFRWGNSQVLQGGVLLQSLGAATEQGPDPTKSASDMTTENGNTHKIDKHGVILMWKMITNIDWPSNSGLPYFQTNPYLKNSQDHFSACLIIKWHWWEQLCQCPRGPEPMCLKLGWQNSRMERAWKNVAWHQIEQQMLNLVSTHSIIKSGFLI